MERRKALELMAAAALGIAMLPGCEFNSTPKFQNFTIDKSTFQFMEELSNKMVPIPSDLIMENRSPTYFLLNMMDYTNSKEDIQKFTTGMANFQKFLKDQKKSNLANFQLTELAALMNDTSTNSDQEIKFFLSKVKSYNVRYYTTLEHYLTTYTDYEFAPGRYVGCVNV